MRLGIRKLLSVISPLACVAGFVIIWHAATHANVSRLRPSPTLVISAAIQYIEAGSLKEDLLASLLRIAVGYSVAVLLALTLAMLCAFILPIRVTFAPLLHAARQIPAIALVPFAVTWLGIGELPKFALIAWAAFFPIWTATTMALSNPDHGIIDAARNLGATGLDLVMRVHLPSCLINILPALRTAIGLSYVVLIAAEMTGASFGIGYRINLSVGLLQVDLAIFLLGLLAALGFCTDVIALAITRLLFPWIGRHKV